jgi:hypothetical protein
MSLRIGTIAATVLCHLLCALPAAASDPADSSLVTTPAHLIISADIDSSDIFIDGNVVGVTPLTLDTLPAGTHRLVVVSRNPGSWFAKIDSLTIVLLPGETRHLRFSVVSPLRLELSALPAASPMLAGNSGENGRAVALYASGGVAIAAGVAAAYFKITADDRNDGYVATGNPALLDERRRLDTAAGIALVASQLGFALFSYLLLAE